ncbi:MAG TPA: ATP-binding protein [Actinomycetota bacterium]|jgi:anti-sigma regulatory factor (Ser/Thr protein kinase)|nr:ATP-binding protein [Actinomycetota bacterium]
MESQVTDRGIELDVRLPTSATAPSSARALVGGLRDRLDDDVLDDLVLVVSEVVTNCVRHAELGPGDDITVRVRAASGNVRLEVVDHGRGFEPTQIGAHDPAMPGGWGLYIVDQLADRWGVARESGTRLWVEIDTGPDGRRDSGAPRQGLGGGRGAA